jgi:hypothetical protein
MLYNIYEIYVCPAGKKSKVLDFPLTVQNVK